MYISAVGKSHIYMAQAAAPAFPEFFESWLIEQRSHLEELVSAVAIADSGATADDHALEQKIELVVEHYEQYYRAKSSWAGGGNAVTMFKPSWRSRLEDAFMWSGGWRPSTAFHLLYSKSGLQLEVKLDEILRGVVYNIEDLGDLSHSQIQMVDLLQRETIREEKQIAEILAKQQEAVADSSMVELSHASTEVLREGAAAADTGGRIAAALARKGEGMERVLTAADGLRLKTLKKVIGILTPRQAVHFLIAAAELHLRLHEWGKTRDAVHHDGGDGGGRGRQQ